MTDLASHDLHRRIRKTILIASTSIIMVSLLIVGLIVHNGISVFSVHGDSMEPTLANGNTVIIRQSHTLTKGEFIFFKRPNTWNQYGVNANTIFVKRIIAVPGDTISFTGKNFIVNGNPVNKLPNGYNCSKGQKGYTHKLTDTQVLVMGDNAPVSLDSRRVFCDGYTENMYISPTSALNYGSILWILKR